MNRRNFIASCASATGGVAALSAMRAQAQDAAAKGPLANVPLRMSCPLSWFKGSFEEQLQSIAQWGFPAYEWLGPKGDPAELRAKADAAGLKLSCIGGAGSIAPGGMVQPEDHDRLVEQFKENVARAKVLGCTRLIGLSGNERSDISRDEQKQHVADCLKRLAPIAQENDVIIVLEALNVLVDHGGYLLATTADTMDVLKAVDHPNVKMCFDIYHQQITEGNVIRNLTENIDRIGHFHVGDNPGRQEPGSGELNYKNIFKAIAETNYDGFVALECGTSGDTERALQRLIDCFDWA